MESFSGFRVDGPRALRFCASRAVGLYELKASRELGLEAA